MDEFVYLPTREQIDATNLMKLAKKHNINSIKELYDRADRDQHWFWKAIIDDCNIEFFTNYTSVVDSTKGKPWSVWFKDGKINITYNAVERFKHSQNPAIKYEREDGTRGVLSFAELDKLVGKMAGALKKMGVTERSRVGIYMPMSPESVIAFYSIMRIGAIVVPMFSGYGRAAIETRVKDAGIEWIFTTHSYYRKGKKINMIDTVRELDNVEKIVYGANMLKNSEHEFTRLLEEGPYVSSVMTDSEAPAIILYTSGTTGKPKGTVHVHGGALVNIVKEVKYYLDFKENDTLFWITDLGWMMGPWELIGANVLGGAVFVYEGAINYPDEYRLWHLISQHHVTILGVSPTLVRMLKAKNIKQVMKGIRVFGSTGEPWDEESWLWLFEKFGNNTVPIANISGGTDIIGCFLASTPAIPLKPRCLYRGLGMNVAVFDETGVEVFDKIGYLVAKKPSPSMTRGLWNNSKRYIDSYWNRFSEVWFHGDWAMMDREGYFYLYGRADDVIKVAGKRVGPNEVENVVMKVDEVQECAVVGVPDPLKGEVVCVVYTGSTTNIEQKIKTLVARELGKAFVPKYIVHVQELPKTRNGKIMRRVIKRAFIQADVGDVSNIDNFETVEEIRKAGQKYFFTK